MGPVTLLVSRSRREPYPLLVLCVGLGPTHAPLPALRASKAKGVFPAPKGGDIHVSPLDLVADALPPAPEGNRANAPLPASERYQAYAPPPSSERSHAYASLQFQEKKPYPTIPLTPPKGIKPTSLSHLQKRTMYTPSRNRQERTRPTPRLPLQEVAKLMPFFRARYEPS